jgi:hypothetical protein
MLPSTATTTDKENNYQENKKATPAKSLFRSTWNLFTRHEKHVTKPQKTWCQSMATLLPWTRTHLTKHRRTCIKQPETFYQSPENMLDSTRKHYTKHHLLVNHKSENILPCIFRTKIRKHVTHPRKPMRRHTMARTACHRAPANVLPDI